MIADLDTLLIALYVELTDRIIPYAGKGDGLGRPPEVTDAGRRLCCAMTTSGTGCAPRPPGWGTCSPACCAKASTTSVSKVLRR